MSEKALSDASFTAKSSAIFCSEDLTIAICCSGQMNGNVTLFPPGPSCLRRSDGINDVVQEDAMFFILITSIHLVWR